MHANFCYGCAATTSVQRLQHKNSSCGSAEKKIDRHMHLVTTLLKKFLEKNWPSLIWPIQTPWPSSSLAISIRTVCNFSAKFHDNSGLSLGGWRHQKTYVAVPGDQGPVTAPIDCGDRRHVGVTVYKLYTGLDPSVTVIIEIRLPRLYMISI